MRKSVLILASSTLIFFVSTMAYSAEDPYVSLSLGFVMPNDSDADFDSGETVTFGFDDGFAFSGAIGGRIEKGIRAEAEFSYLKSDLDKASVSGFGSTPVDGDISSISLLANGYFDFINEGPITPFFSAGIGITSVEVSDITIPSSSYYLEGDDDIVFAYQIGAGVGFSLNEQTILDIKYRYFATSDPDFEIASAEFSSHNLFIGIRVSFNTY